MRNKHWFSGLAVAFLLYFYFALNLPVEAIASGQILRDPTFPNRMIYHGTGKSAILCGPGDPEDLFYNNSQNNVNFLINKGAKTTYVQAYLKDFGGGSPGDPNSQAFDNTLNQWDDYITQMENAGIATVFFFFDDSHSLPANWEAAVTKIVNKLKHHKLLIWSVAEEYREALNSAQVVNVARKIRELDGNGHVVGVHQNHGVNFDFNNAQELEMFLIQYNNANPAAIYDAVRSAYTNTNGKKILNMSEIADHAIKNLTGFRQINWAAVMGGASMVQVLDMGRASDPSSHNTQAKYDSCKQLMDFFEATTINTMVPADTGTGSTDYVLSGDNGHIAYTDSYSGNMGVQGLSGVYDLTWYDIANNKYVSQHNVSGSSWTKPQGINGPEIALYIKGGFGTEPNPTPSGSNPADLDGDDDVDAVDREMMIQNYGTAYDTFDYNWLVTYYGVIESSPK